MSDHPILPSAWNRLKLRWRLLLRWVLHLWVKARCLPEPFPTELVDSAIPVCYVIDNYALSSLLILDKCCENLGLQRALFPIMKPVEDESRAFAALQRMRGLLIRHRRPRRNSEILQRLVKRACNDPGSGSSG